MSDTENKTKKPEVSFEVRIKEIAEQFYPYAQKLWNSRWKFILVNGIVLAITLVILLFVVKPYYDSTVTIFPDYGNQNAGLLSQLSGLAGLAGVNVGQSNPIVIYQNLVGSEAVLAPVINKKYRSEEFKDSVNLIQYFEIDPNPRYADSLHPRQMFLDAMQVLAERKLRTDVDKISNILTITVRMNERALSADVVNAIAASLNQYILTQRKSFAGEQRKYMEKRLAELEDSLSTSEDELIKFQQNNKLISQSPELQMEQNRLQRMVNIKQTVYLQLLQQYELIKIEEIKDTPVINLREEVLMSIDKTGPRRMIMLILVMFFTGVATSLYFGFQDELKRVFSAVINVRTKT